MRFFQSLSFHGLENLRHLRLRRNQIEYLPDAAFFGLPAIEELSLVNLRTTHAVSPTDVWIN